MIIYPAIDIKDGKCVRLIQGRAKDQTVYSSSPVDVAKKWESMGAQYLHVVDLDGAFDGQSANLEIVYNIARDVSIPVQVGGGIRSIDKVRYLLEEAGVQRVILGTSAVENPALVSESVSLFGNRIVAGIDARAGKVAIRGWVQESTVDAVQLGIDLKAIGIDTIIYTDISRDGMMTGPNIEATAIMIKKTGLNVIASGGDEQHTGC
jgi:phosphoribosylformimino-5-aminoimidazole carboxamide ribotide isomerase